MGKATVMASVKVVKVVSTFYHFIQVLATMDEVGGAERKASRCFRKVAQITSVVVLLPAI